VKNKKKILVVGGLHGDESSGVDLVRRLRKNIPKDTTVVIANPDAVKKNIRFVETDMNRSFAVEVPVSLEEKVAAKLKSKVLDHDVVIDVHNTKAEGTTCAITVCKPSKLHFYLANHFGFDKLVIMPPSGSLISVCPDRAVSLEIETGRRMEFSTAYLMEKIKTLGSKVDEKKQLEIYRFINRVPRNTLVRLDIDLMRLTNFQKLSRNILEKLGLSPEHDYYPIFFKSHEKEEVVFTLVKYIGTRSIISVK